MPGASSHWSVAKQYIDAARLIAQPPNVRPFSLLAYYGTMHMFEAMHALGIPGGVPGDFFNHHDRIAFALRNMASFGTREATGFYALYDCSYKARYIQADDTTYDGANRTPVPRRGQVVDLDKALPRDQAQVDQISKRVNRILRKTKILLTDKKFEFTLEIDPLPEPAPENGVAEAERPAPPEKK